MATLVLTAVGSLFGPLGGALGGLIGRQIDGRLFAPSAQKGPRLKELSVTASSYGAVIPRHYGRMRTGGTIIWSTELKEHREKSGGGKGRPKVTTYSYSVSFAVALSSRPLQSIGRIWADGNLLRGAAGDLKTGGAFRFHAGMRDQQPDPLIAAAEAPGQCPAFRGLAYCVFEDLDLSDFGNRIPALTFEVFADEEALSLADLMADAPDPIEADVPLSGLAGFTAEGSLLDSLSVLAPAFPVACDAAGSHIVFAPHQGAAKPIALPAAAVSGDDGDFGGRDGKNRTLRPPKTMLPAALRYYDVDRDYQPGLQRGEARAGTGEVETIDLPAALSAFAARDLARGMFRQESWSRHQASYRTTVLDPEVRPGAIVSLPDEAGLWRVHSWEWRASGVELSLQRIAPAGPGSLLPSDSGRANPPPDQTLAPTALVAFELPWDGTGAGDSLTAMAAVSSVGAGWTGAALFADQGSGELVPLGPSGRERSLIGTALTALPATPPHLFDRAAQVEVQLIDANFTLTGATRRQLAMGVNRGLLGEELIQFGTATPLGGGRWLLGDLLRGRGGTETAIGSHQVGEPFVLLDGSAVALDPAIVGCATATAIIALGRGDNTPVASTIHLRGITRRPLSPVHPRSVRLASGALDLGWTRRARGAYDWPDGVDLPLNEQSEHYRVLYGPLQFPVAAWEVAEPRLLLPADVLTQLAALAPGADFHVCQLGSLSISSPLRLATLS